MLYISRNDAVEEWYSMVITFDDQKAADSFYLDLNGWHFPSEEVLLFLSGLVFLYLFA